MCGRFITSFTNNELMSYIKETFNLTKDTSFKLPRYNVSPGDNVISLIYDGINYRIGELNWGYVPNYNYNNKINKLINARSESVFEKISFKKEVLSKRCVVLADGFYEWNYDKKPFLFKITNQKIFPIAGIYNSYKENNETVYSVLLLTTKNNRIMDNIHERMPVILNDETSKIWLNNDIKDKNILKDLLKPYDDNNMTGYQVSTLVNNSSYDDISLTKPI